MKLSVKPLLSGSILSAILMLTSACSSTPAGLDLKKPISMLQPGKGVYFFENFGNYDDHIPGELLRRAYAADKLRSDEAERRIAELYERTHGE